MTESTWTEDEYRDYLEKERRLFAWTLQNYGSYSPADAEREAIRFYEYEPPSTEGRGLVFHDEAWHWAMRTIFGQGYWHSHPKYWPPPQEYREAQNKQA